MNEEMKKIDKQAVYDDIDEIIDRIEFECNEVYKIDIKQLQQRIDKAIEYIESCTWNNGIDNELQYSLHVPTLLNILKGANK